jgi:hypothetical protein
MTVHGFSALAKLVVFARSSSVPVILSRDWRTFVVTPEFL